MYILKTQQGECHVWIRQTRISSWAACKWSELLLDPVAWLHEANRVLSGKQKEGNRCWAGSQQSPLKGHLDLGCPFSFPTDRCCLGTLPKKKLVSLKKKIKHIEQIVFNFFQFLGNEDELYYTACDNILENLHSVSLPSHPFLFPLLCVLPVTQTLTNLLSSFLF